MCGGAAIRCSPRSGQPVANDQAERLITFAELARRYFQAKLVFSDGGMSLKDGKYREADTTHEACTGWEWTLATLSSSGESRNTSENVVDSKAIVYINVNDEGAN
jgi:hypothetical protein